jgi:hypothetical protein
MNPLLTQKIEWGVRLKMGEIVGEREKANMRERGVDGSGSEERGIEKTVRSSFRGRHIP